MNKTMFNPGFRLSILDTLILTAGLLGAWLLKPVEINLSYIILFVVGHFFYFCNITRMSRIPELIWATSFIITSSLSITYDIVSLTESFLIALAITIVLTVLELRKPSYHGMLWSRINPNLKEWFDGKNTWQTKK